MRIAFFADNNYPELSGIVDSILITGRELVKRGHDVLYVGPYYSPKDYAVANRTYPETHVEDQVDGMRFIRLPSLPLPFSPTGQSRIALPFGASYSATHEFKPDVVHTHSPWSLGVEARRVARRMNVPLIGTNHTDVEDFFPLPKLVRKIDARYYNNCDFVSVPYAALLQRMREAGFTKPSKMVSNPTDLSEFSPATADEKVAIKKSLQLDGPVLLFSGRLSPDKRVDVLLRALPELIMIFPTLTLLITGRGAAETRLKALATELKVAKHVQFMGFVPWRELARIYKAADVFTLMSTSDSQSLALMQAFATGIPAVCARARGLPDYTPENCGFLVEPGDHKALAEKVAYLLKNEGARAKMGLAGIEFVKKLSPTKIVEEWEHLYTKILKNK